MFRHFIIALAGVSTVYATNFMVQVGPNGTLTYQPPFISGAQQGDTIEFIFNPKNHSVTQSSFDTPCTPLTGGFDSDFKPTTGQIGASYTVTVQDPTVPTWIHCKQPIGQHCAHGMVFAINPPMDGPNTFQAFQNNALATLNTTTTTATPDATPPSTDSVPPPSPTVTAVPTPAATQTIQVGPSGQFVYDPMNITANPGDVITFIFNPKNHTVTQSNFANPCIPLEQSTGTVGFKSGFNPVSNDTTTPPTFQITVNDTKPIWGYCGQTGHCAAGMVFAINAPLVGNNTFAAFRALAMSTNSSAPSPSAPSAPSSPSSAALPRAHISGSIFGVLLMMVFAL